MFYFESLNVQLNELCHNFGYQHTWERKGRLFWQALELLHAWERKHLPGADTAVGNEVLVWLLKSRRKPRPLKDLYRSSRFSEPTIRKSLKEFVDLGFAIIQSNDHDMRNRFAQATPKLETVVAEYQKRFQEIADLAHVETSAKAPSIQKQSPPRTELF